jgi:hypothetical protein
MSYFAVISGAETKLTVSRGSLVPALNAQSYISNLAAFFESTDGPFPQLWEDGESGTTDEIISDAEGEIANGCEPKETDLGRVLVKCQKIGATVRVRWAGNSENPHMRVQELESVNATVQLIRELATNGNSLCFVMRPCK